MTDHSKVFQQLKQKMIENEWVIVSETKNQLILKEDEQEQDTQIFTYFEKETSDFLEQSPEVQYAAITCLEEKSDRSEATIEVKLNFTLRGNLYYIAAHVGTLWNYGTVWTMLALSTETKGSLSALKNLQPVDKEDVKRIYERFKHLVSEMPAYRLLFATQEILYEEKNVMNHLILNG